MEIKRYNEMMDYVNKNAATIEKDLTTVANNFLQENFDMRLGIPIKLNGRLTRTLGRYTHDDGGASVSIEISKIACVEALLLSNNEALYGILKHECVHYALYEQGISHEDHSPQFISSCQLLGVPITGMVQVKQRVHEYNCSSGHTTLRRRKIDTNKYACGCGASLTYSRQIIR